MRRDGIARLFGVIHVVFRALRTAVGGPQYSVVPRVYWRMQAGQYWTVMLIGVLMGMLTAFGWLGNLRSAVDIGIVVVASLVVIAILTPVSRFILRRRWNVEMSRVRAGQYLFCPSCGQNLHGCLLEGGTHAAAKSAAVRCPECGTLLSVHKLMEAWEAHIPGISQTKPPPRDDLGRPLWRADTCAFCGEVSQSIGQGRRCPRCLFKNSKGTGSSD